MSVITSVDISVSNPNVRAGEALYASEFSYATGSAAAPDSVDYRVDDITASASTSVRGWTAAALGPSTSIILENEDVAMLNSADLKEIRRVMFRVIQGATTFLVSGTYLVTNLGFQSVTINLGCDMSSQLERYLPLPSSRISRNVDLDNWNP